LIEAERSIDAINRVCKQVPLTAAVCDKNDAMKSSNSKAFIEKKKRPKKSNARPKIET